MFGYVSARTDFCTMGALSDAVHIGDWTRLRMWFAAIALSMAGAWALQAAGLVDLDRSIYRRPEFTWLSNLAGGAALGFGMVLASGCASKTLIRIGSGSLKSLVVAAFLAISADMTLRGLLASFRIAVLDRVAVTLDGPQDLGRLIAAGLGVGRPGATLAAAAVVVAALLAFCLAAREARARIFGAGALVALTVLGGWYLTGHIGYLAEHPETLEPAWLGTNSGRPESLSLVGPQAYALELLTFWSDRSRTLTFGIAAVAGVIAGSLLHAIQKGRFRLESFRDAEDTLNHMAGGILMGFGGVTALGCTIGQGVSGLSTLALGSFIAFAGIVCGALGAFRYLAWRAG